MLCNDSERCFAILNNSIHKSRKNTDNVIYSMAVSMYAPSKCRKNDACCI